MHLDEDQVQRLLHGELSPPAERSAREHIAGCDDCRRRLSAAEREENEVHALLRVVDYAPPEIRAETITARAQAADPAARARDAAWPRLAAGFLLVVGIAGVAYAVPGSPVRAWVHEIVQRMGVRPEPSGASRGPGGSPAVSGIAVLPERRLLILFKSDQAEGGARVSLTDDPEVRVEAPVGAATFASGADRLLIDNEGSSATFEIRIPRSATWVEIRVGGDRVFLKDGSRVTTTGSMSVGGYVLRLTPPGS